MIVSITVISLKLSVFWDVMLHCWVYDYACPL